MLWKALKHHVYVIIMKVEFIKRRILGCLAIVYSIMSPILPFLLLSSNDVRAHTVAIITDGILWIPYFIGGIGLLLNQKWGKYSVIIIFSISLLIKVSYFISFSNLESDYDAAPVLLVLGIKMTIAFLFIISAFSIEISPTFNRTTIDSIAIKSETVNQNKIDAAYMCFLVLGYLITIGFIISILLSTIAGDTSEIVAALGIYVMVPLFFPLLGTIIAAFFLSFRFWRHRQLPIMSGLIVLLLISVIAVFEFLFGIISIIYLILSVSLGINWFAFTREKFR